MHPDYIHNPPNILPPPLPPPFPHRPLVSKKSYYLILFVNSRNLEEKGQAIVYRRKTLDMLFDLIGDIDDQYYHTLYDNTDLTYLDQETRNIDLYFRVIYTSNVNDIYKYINPNGYVLKFDWQDIPNTNYPNQFHPQPFPPPCHFPHPQPKPPGIPPLPRDYIITQCKLSNEIAEKFGDQE